MRQKRLDHHPSLHLNAEHVPLAVKCSPPLCDGSRTYEINYRMVFGLLEIGAGKSPLEKLCSVLNMPKAMSMMLSVIV